MIYNELQSYISDIYPSIGSKKQIDIGFIPVAITPKPSDDLIRFYRGAYIMRIAVSTTEPHHTYFYQNNQDTVFAMDTPLGSRVIQG